MKTEKATFGGGCFWGVEPAFRQAKGVVSTRAGYAGGTTKNPSYKEGSSGKTGHAESVEVTFDADKLSYNQLLEVFWKNHDPTQMNRQGPDVGEQYRSVIFYHSEKQRKEAEKSKEEQQKKYGSRKVVTQIRKAEEFCEAEEYHQQYLEKKGLSTCRI